MSDQVTHEMMSAFAAGCLDKANFDQFKSYLTLGGELPTHELGELQRIIIEGDNGRTILTGCGEDALMVTLTPEKTKLGIVLMELGRASKKISESLK